MILALDVHYRTNQAYSVGFLFDWNSVHPTQILLSTIENIEEYIPGEFYKRELPCLMAIINQIELNSLEAIIVDGHVYVDNDHNFGLGGKLWDTINKQVPIIGVAKTSFYSNRNTVEEVFRGDSKKPLYVSAVGMDRIEAAKSIQVMQGEFRIPNILKQLDVETKKT